MKQTNERIYKMAFSAVYPMLVQKAERKGRTKEEVDKIILWLTGYNESELKEQIDKGVTIREFYDGAPNYNPNAEKITGVICGVRVESIEDPLMKKIRQLDKMIDELAKGKPIEKILRS